MPEKIKNKYTKFEYIKDEDIERVKREREQREREQREREQAESRVSNQFIATDLYLWWIICNAQTEGGRDEPYMYVWNKGKNETTKIDIDCLRRDEDGDCAGMGEEEEVQLGHHFTFGNDDIVLTLMEKDGGALWGDDKIGTYVVQRVTESYGGSGGHTNDGEVSFTGSGADYTLAVSIVGYYSGLR
jgi:hypothetical protein